MTYMLDTNICVYVIKHKPEQVFQRMQENLQKGLCISAVTLAELEHGIEKSSYPEKNRAALTRFLAIIKVLPFDETAANEYGKVCAGLQRRGTPIGTMDMLIAEHAIAADCIIVANHIREFERVPGLTIENWVE